MKILSIECSATPCSVALIEDGNILASDFINDKLTHSQTLMPMVESVLKSSDTSIKDINGFAVAAGPGSFTGVRIGISAIKGLAAANKTPCAAVSTLYAMAKLQTEDSIVCPVMDARCNQVYNAIFDITNGQITRLCEDRAVLCEDLAKEIEKIVEKYKKPVIIMGDGAALFFPFVESIAGTRLTEKSRLFQNAEGVAKAAEEMFSKGEVVMPNELLPVYLRLPQAERELKLKKSLN